MACGRGAGLQEVLTHPDFARVVDTRPLEVPLTALHILVVTLSPVLQIGLKGSALRLYLGVNVALVGLELLLEVLLRLLCFKLKLVLRILQVLLELLLP